MSPIIDRLKREIRETTDPIARAGLSARLAGCLARAGRFDDARSLLEDLRAGYGHHRNARVSVSIMVAEGLLHFYRGLNPHALDRMQRAQTIALAMKDETVLAWASAWKAFFEFEASDFESMADSLNRAIASAARTDHDAWARISMTLCIAFEYCGERQLAQRWFARAHEHAVAAGDEASIEALQHNRAAFRISALFVEQCFGEIDPESRRRGRIEIDTAMRLQALTGIEALTNQIRLAQAQGLIVDGQYAQAIDTLRALQDLQPIVAHNFCPELITLEIAYCLFRGGQVDAALGLCAGIDGLAFGQLDLDDRLAAAWMNGSLCAADTRFGDAAASRSQLDEAQVDYLDQRRRLAALLAPFELD